MPGARIQIDVTGIDTAERRLAQLAAAGRDLTPAMADIGDYLVRSTRERFRDEQDPDGNAWAPLSEFTRARKKRNPEKIGTEEGHLSGQIAFQASATDVLVGSGRIYAGTFQFGAEKGAFGTTGAGSPIPWGDIPARPFVGLSDADRDEITTLVVQYLSDML